MWALDTGRPRVNGTYLFAAVPGGPKLVGFYLNGTSFVTYTFPDYVVYADSSLNDVRIDLRGEGYAYITDSSPYRPAIVVINLSTGESWRHLDGSLMTSPDPAFVPVYDGGTLLKYRVCLSDAHERGSAFLLSPNRSTECHPAAYCRMSISYNPFNLAPLTSLLSSLLPMVSRFLQVRLEPRSNGN